MIKFIENLRIKTKIISGFLMVSFFIILIGLSGYYFINYSNEKNDNLYQGNRCVDVIGSMQLLLSQENQILYKMAEAESKFELDSFLIINESLIKKFETEFHKGIEEFNLYDDRENKLYNKNNLLQNFKIVSALYFDKLIPALKKTYYLRLELFSGNMPDKLDYENEIQLQKLKEFNRLFKNLAVNINLIAQKTTDVLTDVGETVKSSIIKVTEESLSDAKRIKIIYLFLAMFGFILILLTFPAANYFIKPFYLLKDYITQLGKGIIPEDKIQIISKDELGDLAVTMVHLADGLKVKADFSSEIQKGNFNHNFHLLSKDDILGHSLQKMNESLKNASIAEKQRQIDEQQRAWITQGLAKFADIMRQSRENIEALSDEIIKELVKYMNANQGGLFIYNDENKEQIVLDLIACYAYDRKKYADKTIRLKEGYIGTCAIEKEIIYMTNIPDDYIHITSGLGDANPKSLILVPLKLEENIFGVIEIASFNELQNFEIQFLEKIAESIASTLSSVKTSLKTQQLLKYSQEQSAQLTEQEEELRQNLEEMQATQDEMKRKELEMTGQLGAINKTNAMAEYDMNGMIIKANTIFCELLKYKPSQLIGKKHSILVKESDSETNTYFGFWENLRNNEHYVGEYVRLTSDKSEVYFKGTYFPISDSDGNPYKIVELAIDITAQKELLIEAQQITEEMQSQQEELHRRDMEMNEQLIAINNTLATLEYDTNGNIIGANEIFCKLFGYSVNDILGKHHSIFFDNKNLKNSTGYKKFWEDIHAGKHFHGEMKRISHDGSDIIIIGSSHPFFDKNNNLFKVMEFSIDITEQKQLLLQSQQKTEELKSQEEELKQNLEEMHTTQEELKRKEQDMASQLEAIDNTLAVLEFDTNGIIMKANEIFCNILGYEENELIGKHHSIVIEDKNLDNPAYKNFWETIRAHKHVQGEKKRIAKNGSIKTVVRSSFPFIDTNDEVYKVLEVFIDITKQKNLMLESQLQSERQMKIELETKKLYETEIDSMFNLWYKHLGEIENVFFINNNKN